MIAIYILIWLFCGWLSVYLANRYSQSSPFDNYMPIIVGLITGAISLVITLLEILAVEHSQIDSIIMKKFFGIRR